MKYAGGLLKGVDGVPLKVWAPVAGALTTAFAVLLAVRPEAQATIVIDDLLLTVVPLAAAGLAWRRRGAAAGTKTAWTLLAAGCLSWGLGNAAWTYYELLGGRSGDFTSVADVGYLAAYPLFTLAFVRFSSGLFRRATRVRLILESLVVGTAFFALASDTLARLPGNAAITGFDLALTLAYPALAVVAVSVAWQAMTYAAAPERRIVQTATLAALVLAATETLYGVSSIQDLYTTGQLVDVGWLAGFLLLALAACTPANTELAAQGTEEHRVHLVDLVPAAAVAWAVLSLLTDGLSSLLAWSLVVLTALLLLRQATLVRERNRLVKSLWETQPGS